MSATFDTGMLIALGRNERKAWTALRRPPRDDIYTGDTGDLEHLAEHVTSPVAIVPIGH